MPFRVPCVTGQHQRLIEGDNGLKRSRFHHGVSYANFVAHMFQHLQGSFLDSSCEVVRAIDCAFACVANTPCVSFNVASSPKENGKLRCELLREDMFRSPDSLIFSRQFHHYSIKVGDNLFEIHHNRTFSHYCKELFLQQWCILVRIFFLGKKRGKIKLDE